MTDNASANVSRRSLLRIFAAASVVAAPTYANAFGLMRGAGDIRRIRMTAPHNGESMDIIYWVDGNYIPEAFDEISYFMRDWRSGKVKKIDPRTIDIATAAHHLLDTSESYTLLSGYRTPETNRMLRSHSKLVAKNSLHMKGEAADLRLSTRSVRQMASAAMSCHAGGVGTYTRSDFVHMDCGEVRHWGS